MRGATTGRSRPARASPLPVVGPCPAGAHEVEVGMTKVQKSVEVAVPVRTAYDQWTQFEEFPQFMSGVQQVEQLDERTMRWVAEIAGVRRQWIATVLEQVPDERVAGGAGEGATNAGAVPCEPLGTDRTRVNLVLDYEPEG